MVVLNTQSCASYSFNYCFNTYLIGRLNYNLPLTLVAAGVFVWLVVTSVGQLPRYKEHVIILATLLFIVIAFRNVTKHNFGGIFTNIMLCLVAISVMIIYTVKGCVRFKHRLPWKTLLAIFVLALILLKLRFDYAVKHSCDKWADGLHQRIDNSSQFCQLEHPQMCHAELLHGLMDLSRYFDTVKCENQETAPALLRQYYKTEGPFIGLGVTTQLRDEAR